MIDEYGARRLGAAIILQAIKDAGRFYEKARRVRGLCDEGRVDGATRLMFASKDGITAVEFFAPGNAWADFLLSAYDVTLPGDFKEKLQFLLSYTRHCVPCLRRVKRLQRLQNGL
jgi:hypothetical protein